MSASGRTAHPGCTQTLQIMSDKGYSKRSLIILAALGLLMILNLVMLDLFITGKFYGYTVVLVRVFGSADASATAAAAIIFSAIAGGILAFAVIKLIELLGVTLGALHHRILAGVIPSLFLLVHMIGFVITLISGRGRLNWACITAAMAVGLGLWAITVKWRTEIDMLKLFIRELREK